MSHTAAYHRCESNLDALVQAGLESSEEAEALRCQMNFHLTNLEKEKVMSTVTQATYQSRWGHHPVSYETFRKLKMLHKRYWETVYAVGRWVRWERKTVHRHGPEPTYCPVFVEDRGQWLPCTHKQGDEKFPGIRYYPKTLNGLDVIEAYQAARRPVENPEDVQPIKFSEEKIDRLYTEVEKWFEEN